MISLRQLRVHLYTFFNLMVKTPTVFEVVYKGKVYELHVIPSDKEPDLKRKRTKLARSKVVPIDTKECEDCGSLMFNDVCMNRDCGN